MTSDQGVPVGPVLIVCLNASSFAECVLCARSVYVAMPHQFQPQETCRSPSPPVIDPHFLSVAMAKTGYVALTVDQWDHWLWNPVPDVQTYFSASVSVYKAIAGVGRRCLSEY